MTEVEEEAYGKEPVLARGRFPSNVMALMPPVCQFARNRCPCRAAVHRSLRVYRKAIVEVQSGRMSAFAKTSSGAARLVGMLRFGGHDFNAHLVQPQVQLAAAGFAETRFDHPCSLEQGGGRNQADRIGGDAALKWGRFRFIECDRDNVSITISWATRSRRSR